jgi:hypothetical protein
MELTVNIVLPGLPDETGDLFEGKC